jgi:glycine/D-amino acid oxidase-like deaminating enzyme
MFEVALLAGSNLAILPTPDFTWDPAMRPPIADLRPYRDRTFRLEPETVGDKFVVHNYGHGGAGITLSWGCAQEIVDIVSKRGFSPNEGVGVLGAGVMGLTVATLLKALGLHVTIYAKAFPPHTTSNVAGGQWAPSLVNQEDTRRFNRILRRSFNTYKAKGEPFGVFQRINYTLGRARNFESCPRDIIPTPKQFSRLPFANLTSPGYGYSTLLIEPPIFLAKVLNDLAAFGVARNTREFHNLGEVSGMTETIIVNCTGLGSQEICKDKLVHPIKGQLVLLPPQPHLEYLFAGHHGYLFPRHDAVVVGGSEETNPTDEKPDLQICRQILANMRGVFEANQALVMSAEAVPEWAMRNK